MSTDNEIALRARLNEFAQDNEKLQRKWVEAEKEYDQYRRRLNEAHIFIQKVSNRDAMLGILQDPAEWKRFSGELAELERLLHGYIK